MVARKYQRDARKSNPHFPPWRKNGTYVCLVPGDKEIETVTNVRKKL